MARMSPRDIMRAQIGECPNHDSTQIRMRRGRYCPTLPCPFGVYHPGVYHPR